MIRKFPEKQEKKAHDANAPETHGDPLTLKEARAWLERMNALHAELEQLYQESLAAHGETGGCAIANAWVFAKKCDENGPNKWT